MSDMPTALEDLKRFRAMHVQERRRIARVGIELREANNEGGLHGHNLKILQDQIDAIDRAIADEEKAEG